MRSSTSDYFPLKEWERLFYNGYRLNAEISLYADGLTGRQSKCQVSAGAMQIYRSYGVEGLSNCDSAFSNFQSKQRQPETTKDAWHQVLPVADLPDSLLFWCLCRRLQSNPISSASQRIQLLMRLAMLFHLQIPSRPDLPYQLLIEEHTGTLLKSAPSRVLRPRDWYTQPLAYMQYLQSSWIKGNYEVMWKNFIAAQLDGRTFPLTDHHIRGFSIIGESERCLALFQQLYSRSPSEFQLGSVSNMLFMAMGSQTIDNLFIDALVQHFNHLSLNIIPSNVGRPLNVVNKVLKVNEKPLLVVSSADLRQHPVGRFWLPIARCLATKFRVICIAGQPRDRDSVRDELRSLSDDWWPMEAADLGEISTRLEELRPDIFLDLGGHTADNHPVFLSRRFAPVQATYLGFYGPTYASCCDWWIVDRSLMAWIHDSYPGAEDLWPLPGPSLCYVPDLHGLPDPITTNYQESNQPIYGSFNHTRKLTRATQQRFGAVLAANSDAVLQFRSHSFHDPSVRRYFLQRFTDIGISPHQLQPLPYAPSSADAMADYGRINLHLDSYPVSGTTTTLDSLAMGIPVLTCPTPYYAGAISSAILEHAGLTDHICSDSNQLPMHARWLSERYRSAASRRALAQHVRQSPICDDQFMPLMFVDQIQQMLRQALSS